MADKQKIIDTTHFILSQGLSIASFFTGNKMIEGAEKGIDLLYESLSQGGFIENNLSAKQQSQLKTAIKRAFDAVRNSPVLRKQQIAALTDNKEYIEKYMQQALGSNRFNNANFLEELTTQIGESAASEAASLTPLDFYNLAVSFQQNFFTEVSKEPELAGVLGNARFTDVYKNLKSIVSDIKALDAASTARLAITEQRLAELETQMQQSLDALSKQLTPITLVAKGAQVSSGHFIPRTALQAELQQALEAQGCSRLLLSGAGGIGKSHFCRHLYHTYLQQGITTFTHMGWLSYNGDADEMVYADVSYKKTGDKSTDIQKAWHTLQQAAETGHLLLFIDDIRPDLGHRGEANTPIALDPLATIPCSILLASRNKRVKGFAAKNIPYLEPGECIELFEAIWEKKTNTPQQRAHLQQIIETYIGRNTLVLELAAASARVFGNTLPEFDQRLRENGLQIEQGEEEESILARICILLNMAGLSERQKSILAAFSLFPYRPLPINTCAQWLHQDAALTKERCSKQITALSGLSWLETSTDDTNQSLFAMHAVVSAAVREQQGCPYSAHKHLLASSVENIKIGQDGSIIHALPLLPFVQSITDSFLAVETAEMATHLTAVVLVCYHVGDYPKALGYCERVLAIREKVLGTDHPDTATTYNNIAVVYDSLGEYTKALKYYEKDKKISEKVLGTDHPDTATTYNNMAEVYRAQGDYPKALVYYEEALVIREKVLGTDHPSTAATYNNIAGVYRAQGDYSKALVYYEKALVISETTLGTDHPSTATTYNNMAEVYRAQADYPKALGYYEKALVISETALGTDHPSTATTYNNMAEVYRAQGDYPKALGYHERALVIREKVLGTDHPDTAASYNNIAVVYDSLGEYTKALVYYEKALVIKEKVLGTDHPSTAITYNNIAGVYGAQGDYPKALVYYEKALVIKEKVLGTNHPDTATTYNNMAGVYRAQGDYPKALVYYEKALVIREKVLGTNHPDTATIYSNIAHAYIHMQKHSEAAELFERAYTVFQKKLGESHPSTKAIAESLQYAQLLAKHPELVAFLQNAKDTDASDQNKNPQ